MNCFNCGASITGEHKNCPFCGKSLQIVPDYNVFDDDDINVLMEETTPQAPRHQKSVDKEAAERIRARKEREREREKKRELEKKKQRQLVIVLIAVVAICIILFVAFFAINDMIQRNNASSYDYQIKQAEAALKEGDFTTAEEYYLKALALKPEDLKVRFTMAQLYQEKGMTDNMIDVYEDILSLDSQNYTAYKSLLQYYNSIQDVDAIMELRKGITDDRIMALFQDYAVENPKIYLKGGTYQGAIDVMISSKLNYEIYYTIDGSDPTVNGMLYNGTVKINQSGMVTLKAAAKNEKGIYSNVVQETYYLEFDAPDDPIVKPDGGTFDVETYIEVLVPTGCTAYYTWDRTDPRLEDSTTRLVYVDSILIPSGSNMLSLVIIDDTTGLSSAVYRRIFECTVEGIPVPGVTDVEPDTETGGDIENGADTGTGDDSNTGDENVGEPTDSPTDNIQ